MICRIPFRASLPPCSMSSRRGLAMPELASMSERRPALTTSARGGAAYPTVGAEECLRRGRTKEWEQRNEERRIERRSPLEDSQSGEIRQMRHSDFSSAIDRFCAVLADFAGHTSAQTTAEHPKPDMGERRVLFSASDG
jgi:hypothetical protein